MAHGSSLIEDLPICGLSSCCTAYGTVHA